MAEPFPKQHSLGRNQGAFIAPPNCPTRVKSRHRSSDWRCRLRAIRDQSAAQQIGHLSYRMRSRRSRRSALNRHRSRRGTKPMRRYNLKAEDFLLETLSPAGRVARRARFWSPMLDTRAMSRYHGLDPLDRWRCSPAKSCQFQAQD